MPSPKHGSKQGLAHEIVGDPSGKETAIFLHGILGSRKNWRSFAKQYVMQTGGQAVLVDLRNHGESHRFFPPPHTVEACAADVANLMKHTGGDVVIGHSFGGKVALVLARDKIEPARVVWSLDAPPGTRSPGHSDVERVMETALSVPMPIASRRDLVAALTERGLSVPLANWMTTNLKENAHGTFAWTFDLQAIPEMMASFAALDLWPFIESHGVNGSRGNPRVHLVRAARGERYSASDVERANAAASASGGAVVAHVLKDAGHWLHTDNPSGLLSMLRQAHEAES